MVFKGIVIIYDVVTFAFDLIPGPIRSTMLDILFGPEHDHDPITIKKD